MIDHWGRGGAAWLARAGCFGSAARVLCLIGCCCSRLLNPPPPPLGWRAGGLLQKLLLVTKPGGHVSHIFNAGTDNSVLEGAQAAHAAGTGPSVGTILVQANGEQLQEVGAGWARGRWVLRRNGMMHCRGLGGPGRPADIHISSLLHAWLPLLPACVLQIADLVAAGKVRLEVAQTLPLEQVAAALAQVATGHTRGKVVLTL